MSCNKKKEEEIIKKINVEQEFADLNFKDMRSKRYGLTSCCPLDKIEKIAIKKEVCDWDDEKLPVYLSRSYKDMDDDSTYKYLLESQPIPDWVVKACKPCPVFDDTPVVTTLYKKLTLTSSVIDSDANYIRGTSKIYILVTSDEFFQYNNSFMTIGYGVVPASGSMDILMYGNTNSADPKNGATTKDPTTVIIDVNGDGNTLKKIDYTTVGWNPQQWENDVTPSAAGTFTVYCTFGISVDCTFCGEGRRQDPDMYFFYDVTSLGVQEVINAHNVVESWLSELRAIGAFNGKVYHTSVMGERWLDFAIMPYTGTFNNAGFCGGIFSPGLGTASVIGPQNSNWANSNPTGGAVDAIQLPATAPGGNSYTDHKYWGVLDYFINTKKIQWFDSGDGQSTATYNGTETTPSGQVVSSQGLPPVVQSKEVLMVIFGDESSSSTVGSTQYPQPYHTRNASTTPTWTMATGGTNGLVATPTPCWIADYDKFVEEHNKFISKGTDFKANYFIYPTYPTSVTDDHKQFPLHVVGAIASGISNTGILASAPSNGLVTLSQTTSGTNPYVAAGKGRLDQYNWGYNVDQPATGFVKQDFVDNLQAFWNPGDEECLDDTECISVYVKDDVGNPIECYPVVVDGQEVGYTNEDGFYLHKIKNASVDTKHSIDLCNCFVTTGACAQQRIDITVTPEEAKVVCTPLTVDCT